MLMTQREHHDRPAPVRNVVVQPLQPVKQRVRDEFQPSRNSPAIAAAGASLSACRNLWAQRKRAWPSGCVAVAAATSGTASDSSLPSTGSRVPHLPVARFQRRRRRIGRRQETPRQNNGPRSPQSPCRPSRRCPIFPGIELLVASGGQLSVFAVERVDRGDGRRIRYRHSRQSHRATPSPAMDMRAVVVDGGFHAHHIGMIEVKFLDRLPGGRRSR